MQHLCALTDRPLSSESELVTTTESLEVQLANLTISPGLVSPKAILRSLLRALTPHRSYKEITLALAQQAVKVTMQISTLIEATKEASQWPEHIAHLAGVLLEIQLFVGTETQSNVLQYVPLWNPNSRYTELEKRLTSVLEDAEQYNTKIRAGNPKIIIHGKMPVQADPIRTAQSRTPSPSPMNNADVIGRGEIFSIAHDLTIAGGNFYSGQISIQQASNQESGQGIVPGMRVVPFEDISITREIHRNRGYRLHFESGSGRARVVKVYHGPRAKERAQEAARFHKNVMHPTFLHIVGVSPSNCEIPFLVFNGGFEGSLEVSIAKALEKDLRKSIILGLRTVIGLSAGLDYLRDMDYYFETADSEDFHTFLNLEGEVIISFDPDIAHEQSGDHEECDDYEQSTLSEVDWPLLIFHVLCERTFDAACQAHYERSPGWQVDRTYDDILETEEALAFSDDRDEDVHRTTSTSSINVSSKKALGKLPIGGHRRELVWKPENEENSSLGDICLEFKSFLDNLPASSKLTLRRRRGRYAARTVHRCPGYHRTEITLTPSIMRSAIVSHSTPLPHEICSVCNRVVKDVEIFNCVCGGEDDESVPTIQCSKCCEWHHQHCIDDIELPKQIFACSNCHHNDPHGGTAKNATTSMGNPGGAYHKQGSWNEAEQLFVQVMGMRKMLLGADHPDTLTSMENLTGVYHNQARQIEAERLFLQSWT
ncbi:hypothetical protein BYT27DRAFT_7203460 [Phlegmacium glaucopus]|nr:hypothetical protein BYT27DRAFT_7203460 [Phlegmacium glaucopus]